MIFEFQPLQTFLSSYRVVPFVFSFKNLVWKVGKLFIYLVYSFISVFISCLLCAKHIFRFWGNSSEQNRQKSSALIEFEKNLKVEGSSEAWLKF